MTGAAAHQSQIPRAGSTGFQRVHVTLIKLPMIIGCALSLHRFGVHPLILQGYKWEGNGMESLANTGYIAGYPMMLTVKEVSEILRTGRNTTYELINSGEIPCKKIGRQFRIYSRDLLLYLEKNIHAP